MSVARGLPLPAADEIPPEEPQQETSVSETTKTAKEQSLSNLTVPISSRTQSFNSDSSANPSPSQPSFFVPPSSQSSSSGLLRGRAKTLASLTTSSKYMPQAELQPREINLPKDPFVNGQPLEAYLYKDASECPICFLYYPPYLNRTRCCDQSICSECFVQIKRPDPHPPEHADPSAPPRPPEEISTEPEGSLVSEPAACPFCVQPEFGVTFDPPPMRRGLAYANQQSYTLNKSNAAMSSSSSIASIPNTGQLSPQTANRRRTTSLSANAPTVITTDRVRPDWATKLASARAHAARRAAAATALHTAAYLMGNRNDSPDARGFGGFGRRNVLRRGAGGDSPSSGTSSLNLTMLALMSERSAASGTGSGNGNNPGQNVPASETAPSMTGPPRQSSRRNRIGDLEEMMMMEAIRLSLATEEERRRREEKEAKKEAKKKTKEEKKVEKSTKKGGMYSSSANPSSGALNIPPTGPIPMDKSKGKGVTRDDGQPLSKSAPHLDSGREVAHMHIERNRQALHASEGNTSPGFPTAPYKPSHLRNLSNASSSSSSLADFPPSHLHGGSHSSLNASPNASRLHLSAGEQDTSVSATPSGTEPMFNFRSLAAMIDEEQFKQDSSRVQDTGDEASLPGQAGSSSSIGLPIPQTDAQSSAAGQDGARLSPEQQPSNSASAEDDVQRHIVPTNSDGREDNAGNKLEEVKIAAKQHDTAQREAGSV